MKSNVMRKILSFVLASALVVSAGGFSTVQASAAKAPKLSAKSLTLTVGQSKKLKVKNLPAKAKITWTSSKKAIVSVNKSGKVTARKAGSAKITAKLAYKKSGRKLTKKLTAKVKITAAQATQAPSAAPATQAPSAAPGAVPSAAPTAVPSVAPTTVPSQKPTLSPDELKDLLNRSNLGEEHTSAGGITTKDNGLMRTELSAQDLTDVMTVGWNVGNSLEQTLANSCTSLTEEEQAALTDADWVKGYETNANNPVSTQKLFDGLKLYGINTIRIPVAWSNMMKQIKQDDGSTYYQINTAYMNRVEEVLNYALNNEMYVIINDHWDNGWWGMFGDAREDVRAQAMKKYEDMWTQLAARFREYSDRLIFEGGNEEFGERFNDDWDNDGTKGTLTQEEYYALTNELNQKFVDIIRKDGVNADGSFNNNYYRMLLIPGLDTNLHQTCGDKYSDKAKTGNDKLTYVMPQDTAQNGIRRLFVSIHYYDPLGWGISKSSSQTYDTPKGASAFMDTWGSDADYAAMQEDFDAVKEAFTDKGYAVIFGEFGVVSVNKDGIPAYYKQFFESCKQNKCVAVMWDEGTLVDRQGTKNKKKNAYFAYDDIGQVIQAFTGCTVTLAAEAQKLTTTTGIPMDPTCENQDPLVVCTWEGDFMRNTTNSEAVDLEQIRKNFGDEFIGSYSGQTVGGIFRTKQVTYTDVPTYQGLELTTSASNEWWHSHFQMNDWSKFKKPCIRITMHDDDFSKSADLQLVYSDEAIHTSDNGSAWKYETDFAQVQFELTPDGKVAQDDNGVNIIKRDENGNMVLADTAWQEKVLNLDPNHLENYPVVLLTTNSFYGCDFVKIEFCDAAYNADGSEHTESTARR